MDNLERLDRYLDHDLPTDQRQQLERDLSTDPALRELYDALRMARQAVQAHGLRQHVRRRHAELLSELPAAPAEEARVVAMPVRRVATWLPRIAAGLAFVLLAAGGYWFSRTDAETLYESKFVAYHLPVSRSTAPLLTPLDSLYQAGAYPAVVARYRAAALPTPRDRFLAGVSYLELGQPAPAIAVFEALRAAPGPPQFVEETDFYLALAYLRAHRPEAALPLFTRIRQNPEHPYRGAVTRGDVLTLQALDLKH